MASTGALVRWTLHGKTLLRGSFHEALASVPELHGSVLDVGGTCKPKPTYVDLLTFAPEAKVIAVNIDPASEPDLVGDAAQLPLADASMDAALCFNLLEHVTDPHAVVSEMARVLKTGGRCVIETPFLVNVHGHPDDYWRFTDSALRRMVERAGLKVDAIDALGGGPFLAAASMVQAFFPSWLFVPVLVCARFFDGIILKMRPAWSARWPLGYFVVATKQRGA